LLDAAVFAARAIEGSMFAGLLAGLAQDAALHRKDEVIDECLQAVAATNDGGPVKRCGRT
jgi:hypothetical protein